MKRLTLTLLSAILVVSCASDPNLRTETPHRIVKQCSATTRNAISEWFRGIAEMSINALRALIPDGASVFEVFSNEGKHGQEIVRQILAHPVSGERGLCVYTAQYFRRCFQLSYKNRHGEKSGGGRRR